MIKSHVNRSPLKIKLDYNRNEKLKNIKLRSKLNHLIIELNDYLKITPNGKILISPNYELMEISYELWKIFLSRNH